MGLFGPSEITGIDIGAGSLKVVRLAPGGKRPKLLSAGLVEFSLEPGQESVATDLRFLLSEKKIGRSNVITQMPGKDLTIRSFTLPKMPRAELAEAVRWEAKRHISYPLDAALVEYLITGEKREGTADKLELVMVAAERARVVDHLAPLIEANIKLTAVDANALALRNALHLLDRPDDVTTAVVDIGAGKTEIDIFKGGVLRFSRCLESGGLDMTRAIADTVGVGLPEAEELKRAMNMLTPPEQDKVVDAVRTVLDGLLLEIRRSVEYYKTTFREPGVVGTRLTGGVSLMLGIKEYFAQSLEGPIELDQPFEQLTLKKKQLEEFGHMAPRFSAAIGMALRKA